MTLFVKTTDLQLVYLSSRVQLPYLERMVYGNGSYAMMAKPIRALEFCYLIIPFLIISIISVETDAWCCAPVIYVEDCFIFLIYSNLKEINYISHSNIRASVETSSPKLHSLLQFSPPFHPWHFMDLPRASRVSAIHVFLVICKLGLKKLVGMM